MVLDINMPLMDGIDTLRRLKSDERYRFIPTVVVSTVHPAHVERAFAGYNVLCRSKPDNVADLVDLVIKLLLVAGRSF